MQKLMWDEAYSVNVKRIDDQHKLMFETVNKLVDILSGTPKKEQVDEIVKSLVEYKRYHFATEEEIFEKYGYEWREEHEEKHKQFGIKLDELLLKHGNDSIGFAFSLVDFLEDWLIEHLMTMDQKYVPFMKRNKVV